MDYSQRISRAKSGSREAFDELYDWLFTPVYRYAWAQVSDHSAAEEICSEAFLALVTELSKLPEADLAVMAWMRRVVRNKSVDWIRKNQVQRKSWAVIATSEGEMQGTPSPSSTIEAKEECRLVHCVLHSLPSDYREALELRYLDDLTVQQIAIAMELSMSAANSLLFRARKSFRKECDRQQVLSGEPSVFISHDHGSRS